MPVHTLECTQIFPATLAEAWDFFSRPANLQKITPPSMGFRTLSEVPDEMHAGLMIRYRVTPLLGIPLTWVTEITHVERLRYFVDEQRVGPYRIWHHEHHFRELGDGRIEMTDRVLYQLPLGWCSEPMHLLMVRPQLKKIFAFREEAVRKLFG